MSLIKCPECGKEVSDKATACVHCGFPLSASNMEVGIQSSKEENLQSLFNHENTLRIESKVNKANAKKLKFICVIALSVTVIAILFATVNLSAIKYNYAFFLYEAGKYDKASELFTKLEDYKDSAAMIDECTLAAQYDTAVSLYKKGKFEKAAMAFGRIRNYKDAKKMAKIIWDDIVVRETIYSSGDLTVRLESDGTVVATGDNMFGRCDVSDWSDIVAISASSFHTVGLKSDGSVVATW